MCAVAVGGKASTRIEAGLAAGNDQEDARAGDSTHHLRRGENGAATY
jgi:hypothetical protein